MLTRGCKKSQDIIINSSITCCRGKKAIFHKAVTINK